MGKKNNHKKPKAKQRQHQVFFVGGDFVMIDEVAHETEEEMGNRALEKLAEKSPLLDPRPFDWAIGSVRVLSNEGDEGGFVVQLICKEYFDQLRAVTAAQVQGGAQGLGGVQVLGDGQVLQPLPVCEQPQHASTTQEDDPQASLFTPSPAASADGAKRCASCVALEAQVAALHEDRHALQQEVTSLQESQRTLKEKFISLQEDQRSLKDKNISLEKQFAILGKQYTALKKDMQEFATDKHANARRSLVVQARKIIEQRVGRSPERNKEGHLMWKSFLMGIAFCKEELEKTNLTIGHVVFVAGAIPDSETTVVHTADMHAISQAVLAAIEHPGPWAAMFKLAFDVDLEMPIDC